MKLECLVENSTSNSTHFLNFIHKIRDETHAVDDQTPSNEILKSYKSSLQHLHEKMRPCYDQHSQKYSPILFRQSFIINGTNEIFCKIVLK